MSASRRRLLSIACAWALLAAPWQQALAVPADQKVFETPDEAARALIAIAKSGTLDDLIALLGPGSRELAAVSDPVTARQNREVFTVAAAERWHLEAQGADRQVLLVGNEDWPFPIPLVRGPRGWRFDAVAGREEVLARRIGRNELATIDTCRAYVSAQRRYAQDPHDGRAAGAYAQSFASDPGKENGLYWPAQHGQKRSPLGDLVAQAASEGRPLGGATSRPIPFRGYYFRILTAQGPSAPGGARSYLTDGVMTGGFAVVAWPAVYDVTGVMTFIVGPDGVVYEKDLGPATDSTVRQMRAYDPDTSWRVTP